MREWVASAGALIATLPGVPLYVAFGFSSLEQVEITMEDGVTLEGVAMERAIE